MNITKKYNFRVSLDQFGRSVDKDWFDETELSLIQKFEECVLSLPKKQNYVMLELGSNQAYYSMLFKAMLGKDNTKNIMVEPLDEHILRGIKEFEINNFDGIFLNKGVGVKCKIHDTFFNKPTTSVDEIIEEFKIEEIDCLQCDIDGSEFIMMEGAEKSLKNKKINFMFIATHYDISHHNNFIDKMKKFDYELIFNEPNKTIGSDSLLIYKRKNI
jgi:hypothetical protein